MLKNYAVLVSLIFVLGACNNSNHSSHKLSRSHIEMDMTGMVQIVTERGVMLHLPETLLEQVSLDTLKLEVDTAVYPFEYFIDENFEKSVVALHFHDGVREQDDLRAYYAGDGVIMACYHEGTPHLFCISEALGDLSRDLYRGASEENQKNAEFVSTNSVNALYGVTVID